jgi:hypothetical protein
MGTAVKVRSGFGGILRRELDEQQVTLRELSRRLSEMQGSAPETVRRRLHRYIAGTGEPSAKARHDIAVALELDPDVFDADAERAEEIRQIHSTLVGLAETLHELAVKARGR